MGNVDPTTTVTVVAAPGGPNVQKQVYADAGVATLFRTHVAFMNTEATLIWMRFNSMLIANSVFLGFLTRSGSPPPPWRLTVAACVLGIVLCVAWFFLTHVGWTYLTQRLKEAQKFRWTLPGDADPVHINPASVGVGVPESRQDYIRYWSYLVIGLFASAYLLGLLTAVGLTSCFGFKWED